MWFRRQKRIYLDHGAATPIDSAVLARMTDTYRTLYGNPSAVSTEGVDAKRAIDTARLQVAEAVGAHADEIIFTSGGTESDTMAILGVLEGARGVITGIPHVIMSAIEHAAVREVLYRLRDQGDITLDELLVDGDGFVNPKDLRGMIRPETVLVSVILANNEIGTIEPISEIAKEIRHYRKTNERTTPYPLLHTDASQALNYIALHTPKLGVDLMTLNGGKIYGPKGIGALYVKRGTPIAPMIIGGNQERGLRAGTENTPLIVGFGEAVVRTSLIRDTESFRLKELSGYALHVLGELIPNMIVNGSLTERLPNNINITIPGYASELLVVYLDQMGIAVSAKSACKSDEPEASHVVAAIRRTQSYDLDTESGSLRITMGRSTTKADIDRLVQVLKKIFTIQEKVS